MPIPLHLPRLRPSNHPANGSSRRREGGASPDRLAAPAGVGPGRTDDAADAARAPVAAPVPATKKVFVVEDHPVVREGYALLLRLSPGLELAGVAASAEEALTRLATETPDLVLVDVALPGMNGFDLIARLREVNPALRALVVSGHEASVYLGRTREVGAVGFVPKADGPEALLTAIRSAVGLEP